MCVDVLYRISASLLDVSRDQSRREVRILCSQTRVSENASCIEHFIKNISPSFFFFLLSFIFPFSFFRGDSARRGRPSREFSPARPGCEKPDLRLSYDVLFENVISIWASFLVNYLFYYFDINQPPSPYDETLSLRIRRNYVRLLVSFGFVSIFIFGNNYYS